MWKPVRIVGVLALALAGAGAAHGEEPFSTPVPPETMGRPWSAPDSQEVLFLVKEAEKAIAASNYEKAALKLQNILDYHGDRVVATGEASEERFVGARIWVEDFLRQADPRMRKAYEALARPMARKLLDRAERNRDEATLREVIRRFDASGLGPEAIRALASLCLVSGRYPDAAYWLSRLRHQGGAKAEDLAALALAELGAKHVERAAELIEGRAALPGRDEPVRIGEENPTLEAYLAGLAPRLAALRTAAARPVGGWPVFGGSADRTRTAPSIGTPGPEEWSTGTGCIHRDEDREEQMYSAPSRYYSAWLSEDFHPVHPATANGVVYFQNGGTVYARNLLTGSLLWSASGPIVHNNRGKTNPGTEHAVTVANGVVYANLEIPVPLAPAGARQFASRTVIYYIPRRRLFAFDAVDGHILWTHESGSGSKDPGRDPLGDLNENSPPLVVGDTVYIAASRLDNRYSCYVVAADAKTGEIRWRTRVCTGQQELNLFGRPIKELAPSPISERDGVLYLSSNLGVAAALDRRTGEIQWVRGYDQIPIPYSVQWYRTVERYPTWTNSPPIVTEDAVIFTPTDSEMLISLERETGKMRFEFRGGEKWGQENRGPDQEYYRYLLGIGPRCLYVAGSRVQAIDRKSGKVVWRANHGTFEARPPGGEREEARGRGLVTPDAVWTPTQQGLYAFDPETGTRLSFTPLPPEDANRRREQNAGGNMVFDGNVLLLAGWDTVRAFYQKEAVFRQLKERAALAPDDPHVALELGEIYSKWSRFDEAVRSYQRALELAPHLPPDDRQPVTIAARRGLYTIHMRQGEAAVEAGKREEASKHFQAALDAAIDDQGEIRALLAIEEQARAAGDQAALVGIYRRLDRDLADVVYEFPSEGPIPAGLYALLHLSDLAVAAGKPEEAIRHLSAILARYPHREILGSSTAWDYARDQIARILSVSGREVYAPFEKEARRQFERAKAESSPDMLADVVRLYPNSATATRAAIELGRELLVRGDYRKASEVLRQILAEFPDVDAAPTIQYLLAVALEKRGYLVSARSALLRLLRRHPDARIVVDGKEVLAGEYAKSRLAEPQFAALAGHTPRVRLPLAPLWSEDEGSASYVRVLEPDGIPPPGDDTRLLLGTNGLFKVEDALRHRTVWQVKMNGIVTRPLYVEGVLVLVNSESVAGYDPGTGGRRWEIPINATIRAVGSNPGFVFVLTSSFQDSMSLMLRAISSRSGDVVWTREIPEQELFDLLLVTEESVVFVSRNPAGVTVLDAATGRVRFTVDMLPRSLYREPFLVDGDKLLVVHGNQKVELYETSTGRRVWSKILPGDAVFRGGLAVPGGILYTDSRSNLVLLDAATGEARWTIPPDENNPLQYQEEAADTDHVYLVRKRDADEVYFAEALSIRTGKVVWRTDLVTAKSATPRPLVTDRYVVYHVNSYDFTQGAWTSKTLFLDKQSGQVEQTLEPPDLQGVYTSPVLQDGIFCLSARGKIAVFGPR